MNSATSTSNPAQDERFQALAPRVFSIGVIVGLVGLVLGFLSYFLVKEDGGFARIMLAYLTAFCFFLSISLAAVFFVAVQHLTRAGWSVGIRRIAEIMSMNLVLLAVLVIPILVFAPSIYHHWAHPAAHGFDPILAGKTGWLNVGFFRIRVFIYFAATIIIARYMWSNSVKQDRTGDRLLTEKVQSISGLLTAIIALVITFAAFDLIMSLDPHWFSTMFGVYFFAGGFLAFFATLVLVGRFLQANGIMTDVITVEHYHDIGKWMLAFTFFWGYIAYSQYMLIWYGSIPEETQWFARRGATTNAPEYPAMGAWHTLSMLLIFTNLFIPFAALISRWPKRSLKWLTILAIWIFVFHYVDLYWQILPELSNYSKEAAEHAGLAASRWEPFAPGFIPEICMWIGIGGLWFAGLAVIGKGHSLAPTGDPRFEESLAFENW